MAEIRPYRPADRDAVYDVCVRTADGGGDARGRHSSDDLMPDLYAGPYLHLEPELAFVLDDGDRAVGYVLGTADTAAFRRAVRRDWLPLLAGKHPAEAELVRGLGEPGPEFPGYPAHLHIDLLPAYQRRGWGRQLIDRFRAAAGVGVHLGMASTNTAARAFYDRLGFRELARAGVVTYLGLDAPARPPGDRVAVRESSLPPDPWHQA